MYRLLTLLLSVSFLLQTPTAGAQEESRVEQVTSDISTREISIQSNFTGIEIVLFGSIDFNRAPGPGESPYDVIMEIRGPSEPVVVRRKERVAGIWMNGASMRFSAVPGFYATLASRPLRAIATQETLKQYGIGLANVDFGKSDETAPTDGFRTALIRIQEEDKLFVEKDAGVSFIGRSLFRASVDLPVNVPTGRYTSKIYLFRDGKMLSQSGGSLLVNKAGFEQAVHTLAFDYPLAYGIMAVVLAVAAGLAAGAIFRKT